jgi:polyhydroxybutyrate depolymerase
MKSAIWLPATILMVLSAPVQAQWQKNQKLTIDGIERSYDLFIPDTASGKRPLVLLFHGHVGSARLMEGRYGVPAPYKRWLAIAKRNNLLVAIPNGEKGADRKRGWNDCRADAKTNPRTSDVKFTLAMIEAINRGHPVDRSRIYANGTSNGGNMVIRLALEVPEHFAAVAAVVANNPDHSECHAKRVPISVLFMNGTADPLMPYKGGRVGEDKYARGTVLSTDASVHYWIRLDGTKTQPVVYRFPDVDPEEKSTVVRYSYTGGKDNTEVVLYEVINGGHSEPSKREKYRWFYKHIAGNQNHDIEMADEVWGFFRNKSRRLKANE